MPPFCVNVPVPFAPTTSTPPTIEPFWKVYVPTAEVLNTWPGAPPKATPKGRQP